jgi:hypothetical protein
MAARAESFVAAGTALVVEPPDVPPLPSPPEPHAARPTVSAAAASTTGNERVVVARTVTSGT